MSRYKRNRDAKGAEQLRCVPIQEESGPKSSNQARMCPDTSEIGTQKEQNSQDVSRYKENRDPKASSQLRCVPIQAESGPKSSNLAKMCPDTSEIGTQKHQASQDVSRYQANRDPKASKQQRSVLIQGESGPKRSRTAKMCPDTRRIGTQKHQPS